MKQETQASVRAKTRAGKARKQTSIEYDNLFFCFAIVFPSTVSLFTQTVRLFISTRSIDTLFMYGLLAIVVVKNFPKLKQVITIKDILLLLCGALAFCLAAMSPISNAQVTRGVLTGILTRNLWVYLGAKLVRETPRLNTYLRISSYIMLLEVLANNYIFRASTILNVGYSQEDGYLLLTSLALLFIPLVSEHKLSDIIIAAITLVVILLTGARGPFLFGALLLVAGLFMANRRKGKLLFVSALLTAFVIVVYVNMTEILAFISSSVGDSFSLRTIDRLVNRAFFRDDLRMRQYSVALDYIGEHLLWGSGVVNDRIIMNRAIPSLGEISGSYVHNFILEVGMQFGAVIGAMISASLIVFIIRTYRSCRSYREKLLLIALVTVGFAPLMISGSYLSHTMFYALLGFCNRKPHALGGRTSYEKG